MHHSSDTVPPLLFDRFDGPPASQPGAREAHERAIQLDLLRLFNTRNQLSIAQFLEGWPSVLDYGLPDTLGLSPRSETDLQRWALVITRAIALYEPRLIQVRVRVMPDAVRPTAARVVIHAAAAVGRSLCRFHFDTVLGDSTMEPDTHA